MVFVYLWHFVAADYLRNDFYVGTFVWVRRKGASGARYVDVREEGPAVAIASQQELGWPQKEKQQDLDHVHPSNQLPYIRLV